MWLLCDWNVTGNGPSCIAITNILQLRMTTPSQSPLNIVMAVDEPF
jgi:hypothetical protein